jgi:hypothetical protein
MLPTALSHWLASAFPANMKVDRRRRAAAHTDRVAAKQISVVDLSTEK